MSETNPENGVRFTLELLRGAKDGRYRYSGFARKSATEIPLTVDVVVTGEEVAVSASAAEDAGEIGKALAKVAVPLVRTAVRSAVVRGHSVPRQVQRWRDV
jgi:hypothetical protein